MFGILLHSVILILLPAIVLSVFAYFYLGSKRKDPLEEGKTALLFEQCGGRFDMFNLTIPFVRHAIYDDYIVMAYGKKRILLKYEDIESVTLKWHLFSKGITYRHTRSDIPKSIIIWSLKPAKVARLLSEKGVTVGAKKSIGF
jgi:hypothetical protein